MSPLEITGIQEKLKTTNETKNMNRVTYKSGNLFEGQLSSDWIPHNTGRLCLDGGDIYEVTHSQQNIKKKINIFVS